MAICIIVLDDRFVQLLALLEKALGVEFSREEVPKNPTGITVFSFFRGQTPSGLLKIEGYNDHWLPDEFDLHIMGSVEHTRLFFAIIDAWPGSVLQRANWV